MKNILFLHAGSELYGADIILYNLVKNIDKEKYNVYVILPNNGPLVDKIRSENIYCKVIDYPILRRKYFSLKGLIYYIKNYKRKSDQIYKLIKDKNITIIHNNTLAVLEGIYLKRKLKAKLIVHVHEIIKNPKWFGPLLAKIFGLQCDCFACVSDAVAKELKPYIKNKEKIKVIYNGIDNTKFHPDYSVVPLRKEFNIPADSLVVGMIGRINSWKGQDDFLESIVPLLSKHKNVYALIVGGVFVGEEWRYDKLKEKINKLNSNLNNRIIFSDFRLDNFLIHNLIDIFVLPSINPDPLPTVVLESMASGKPIVAYKHGGVCEMVKNHENGILVFPRDTVKLSEAIEKLIIDEKTRKQMGENSSKREVKYFSIQKQLEEFYKIYD